MRRKPHLPRRRSQKLSETFSTIPVCLYVSVPRNLCKPQNHTCLSMSLYLATFATLATIPVCLSVSVPFNLCNPWNHTFLFISLCTLQPLQPYMSVYLSLYLATFATLETIPVCLSFPVPCNLCNPCSHTCLSICLCTLQPLQP